VNRALLKLLIADDQLSIHLEGDVVSIGEVVLPRVQPKVEVRVDMKLPVLLRGQIAKDPPVGVASKIPEPHDIPRHQLRAEMLPPLMVGVV